LCICLSELRVTSIFPQRLTAFSPSGFETCPPPPPPLPQSSLRVDPMPLFHSSPPHLYDTQHCCCFISFLGLRTRVRAPLTLPVVPASVHMLPGNILHDAILESQDPCPTDRPLFAWPSFPFFYLFPSFFTPSSTDGGTAELVLRPKSSESPPWDCPLTRLFCES